jgi:hypothetical protein
MPDNLAPQVAPLGTRTAFVRAQHQHLPDEACPSWFCLHFISCDSRKV